MMDSGTLETDSGLDQLFPLYSFLHNTAQKAVCRLLIMGFSNAQYVQENLNKRVKSDMTFYNFLCQVNQTIKNTKKGGKNSKNKKQKKSSSSASCSNQQQQQQQQQQYRHPQGQHPAQGKEELHNNIPFEIQNVPDKEKILVKLTVGHLLQKDEEACRPLRELDLNFVMSILLNELVSFRLGDKVKPALIMLKKVRQALVHAKYSFTELDFDKNLKHLEDALKAIYKELRLPDQVLQQHIEFCKEEAKSGNKVHDIINELRVEAHHQYSSPAPTFVPPTITSSQMQHSEVIEDVQKFIEEQQDGRDPMLLCGEQKDEKTRVLERLAWQAQSCQRFKLVLYLRDSHRRRCCHQATLARDPQGAALEFQNQVFACLASLVPNTLYKHGVDAIKAAVKLYQRRILFLINWNVSVLGPVQSGMQRGTWIITCSARQPPQGSWQLLKVAPYTEVQVKQMLRHFPNSCYLLDCYNTFDNKDILSSLDMIQIFCEVSQTCCTGTDFELVEAYVSRTMQAVGSETRRAEPDLLGLGKLAFDALCTRRFIFAESSLSEIQKCVCDSLLCYSDGEGWSFKHSVVRDLLAAKYVVSESSVACKTWVKKEENVLAFKRVFKFVCFMWFQNNYVSKENLIHMETFLRTLLHAPEKRKAKHSEKEASGGGKKSNRTTKREAAEQENKHKNPFDSWVFLMELDDCCVGEGLRRVVSILSDIPCWCFNVTDCLDTINLTRLQKVLKKVTLDKKDPLIIKLKSNTNVALLTQLWRKLRGIDKLYDCVHLEVTIEGDNTSHLSYRNMLEEFLRTIADTQVPLYITTYKGPLFSSCIPSFFKCMCMRRLGILEVSVYDVKSLCEVMACAALPSLQEVFIKVNLELTEQINLQPATIEFPKDIDVHITFRYFPKIQQLLDSFTSRHHLCSLSIHGLYLLDGFKLNLSKFSNLESLNIRFEPECSGDGSQAVHKDRVDGQARERPPRCHWMLLLLNGLILPRKVERLLLRNVEFLNDSNQCFIIKLFQQFNINRLLILDTQLTLTGVGKILRSQTEADNDLNQGGGKRFRRNESLDIRELANRRTRIPREERDAMKWRKPGGKEVVITSDGLLCADCSCFPCMCPSKVDRDGIEGCNSYERMVELINDMYCCNVQTFSYSFNQCTIRKDMCGDLRVHCIMKCLTDTAAFEIEFRSYLTRFFLPLLLAQCVILKETAVTPVGVAEVVKHLRRIKGGDGIESFSLIIETSWHPVENTSFDGIKSFLRSEECLSVVHYRCGCTPKCFHIKKTYDGQIKDVVQAESG